MIENAEKHLQRIIESNEHDFLKNYLEELHNLKLCSRCTLMFLRVLDTSILSLDQKVNISNIMAIFFILNFIIYVYFSIKIL